MTDEKTDLLIQYQEICKKVKKKRILKKPNVAEASQQFESLGISFERAGLPHYGGLCYQAAAKCQNSLVNLTEEACLLLKSSRQFMLSYLQHLSDKSVPNESYLHHSYMYYKECVARLQENKDQNKLISDSITGSVIYEMAENLGSKAGFTEQGCHEYEKALKYFSNSPVERINCLQKIISFKIKLSEYDESLTLINDVVEGTKSLPESGLKEDVLQNSEITRIFLLLILQLTPQQISRAAAFALEKYAWVESSNYSEVKDLQTTLSINGLSMLGEDLFLKLQSLVMACQYSDTDCLELLESDLIPHLNNEQRTLLHILVKQYKT